MNLCIHLTWTFELHHNRHYDSNPIWSPLAFLLLDFTLSMNGKFHIGNPTYYSQLSKIAFVINC